jgi:hypothetical protein
MRVWLGSPLKVWLALAPDPKALKPPIRVSDPHVVMTFPSLFPEIVHPLDAGSAAVRAADVKAL